MASRFQRPRRTADPRDLDASTAASGFGDWWAAVALVGLAIVAMLLVSGVAGAGRSTGPDPLDLLIEALAPPTEAVAAVDRAFASLCADPVLLALELEPDCETGVITLPDGLFNGFGSAELGREAQEDVRAAMRTYLARLRDLPGIWNRLEAIEFRGHSDPRAFRNPYTTNMVGSHQRPIGVLFFLVGRRGLSEADRADLERLAVVSGASFSRPPAACPEDTRECYADWRRVEIRPVLSERQRHGDWARSVRALRERAEALRAARDEETSG